MLTAIVALFKAITALVGAVIILGGTATVVVIASILLIAVWSYRIGKM